MKHQIIGAGFAVLGATRLHRVFAPVARGIGAILMFHRVRRFDGDAFAPNRLLEIEPAFLDAVLTRVRALRYDIVSLDEATRRLREGTPRPFVALTFDDGYRDTAEIALPILERHEAPFTTYVTIGFAERTARLWWVELENAIRALNQVDVSIDGRRVDLDCGTAARKGEAYRMLLPILRAGSDARLLAVVADLAARAGLDSSAITDALCLDWDGIGTLAHHPLCTIGAHTLTHPHLATREAGDARREMLESRRVIERQIGLPVRHFAYPVGDAKAAGPRDFALAADLGFSSAVTTRPGVLFAGQAAHATSLPRVSVNGLWQRLDALEILLSGVPFALWNRGRRIVA